MKSYAKIIISNGHSKFFLAKTFKNIEDNYPNAKLYTSFYPKEFYIKMLPSYLYKFRILKRFINRSENIKNEKNVHNIALSEIFHQIAVFIFKRNNNSLISDYIAYIAMLIYRLSIFFSLLFSRDIKIYHFRSGYGGISLKLAKLKNIYTICDHSFVNPEIYKSLIESNGKFDNNLKKEINF